MSKVVRMPMQQTRAAERSDAARGRALADLDTPIHDCVVMGRIAAQLMSDADDGTQPELCFAVMHVSEMLSRLADLYQAAWHGERLCD